MRVLRRRFAEDLGSDFIVQRLKESFLFATFKSKLLFFAGVKENTN
jgi:hypothetical protein